MQTGGLVIAEASNKCVKHKFVFILISTDTHCMNFPLRKELVVTSGRTGAVEEDCLQSVFQSSMGLCTLMNDLHFYNTF